MSNETAPYVLSEQIGFLLRLASQRHTIIFSENTILELTPMQFSALTRLIELGECSQNKLGRLVGMDIATTKGVVDRLRQKGLIDVRPDPTDKRRSILFPVKGQEDLLERLYDAGREITEKTLAPLTQAERKRLLKIMAKLT